MLVVKKASPIFFFLSCTDHVTHILNERATRFSFGHCPTEALTPGHCNFYVRLRLKRWIQVRLWLEWSNCEQLLGNKFSLMNTRKCFRFLCPTLAPSQNRYYFGLSAWHGPKSKSFQFWSMFAFDPTLTPNRFSFDVCLIAAISHHRFNFGLSWRRLQSNSHHFNFGLCRRRLIQIVSILVYADVDFSRIEFVSVLVYVQLWSSSNRSNFGLWRCRLELNNRFIFGIYSTLPTRPIIPILVYVDVYLGPESNCFSFGIYSPLTTTANLFNFGLIPILPTTDRCPSFG